MEKVCLENLAAYETPRILDAVYVKAHLPKRPRNSHKGVFGRLQIFGGSYRYRGAAHLAALGALRMGVGLLTLTTEEAVIGTVARRLPELLFDAEKPISAWSAEDIERKCAESDTASAILVGPGSGVSRALYDFLVSLTARGGAPVLLDADALGAIARFSSDVDGFFQSAQRPIAMTPHPLEFGRLIGRSASEVQENRMRLSLEYAKKWGVSLLLKGAGTIVADGDGAFLNATGSSALSKGGSGDVLAGAVGAFLAEGVTPTEALAMGAYLHGAAGDSLAKELSEYGVLPSELPRQMAKEITKLK